MPLATIAKTTETFQLKSLEGGYVVIRRMNYGQKLARRAMVAKATMHMEKGKKDISAEMDLMNERASLYEWKNCIVEHNLTYLKDPNNPESETLLDFSNPDHVRSVDGKVGEEIETYIGQLNNFEDEIEAEVPGEGN